ncbi:PHP domain-containing protein [Salinisphaera sp. Q1T1-3]|uniref:PHP domain-containing protein n=1 Tax=Salinisphaera sp. Q1T1-3 TaxID=2321229 RepID=UPI000E74731B|nr:PHP domain-containing protein [Salinisphaera sp. Q1T1-3]RJS94755.1 PHP domain-containing protein [Salinisphaera sp. Q1T1-3]
MIVDLHMHSTASDGALSPADLMAYVAARGVERVALTDHDTVQGLPEARRAAEAHGMAFVDGLEMSVAWQGRTLHIVGLGVDPTHTQLGAAIAELGVERTRRATEIGQRLARAGLAEATERAEQLADGGQITRAHFARLLVEAGLARNMGDAFKRYLRMGRPGHVRANWLAMQDAIDAIHAAGGQAVLAHPFGYGFTHAWRRRAIHAFAAGRGDALEIVTGVTDTQQERQAAQDARATGLLGSAGSDFHAPSQFWLVPGRLRALPTAVSPVAWFRTEP